MAGCGKDTMLTVGMAFRCVVSIVAFLAERGQVAFGIVGRVVVEMGGGEDDPAAGLGVRPVVGSAAPFTASLRALEADAL